MQKKSDIFHSQEQGNTILSSKQSKSSFDNDKPKAQANFAKNTKVYANQDMHEQSLKHNKRKLLLNKLALSPVALAVISSLCALPYFYAFAESKDAKEVLAQNATKVSLVEFSLDNKKQTQDTYKFSLESTQDYVLAEDYFNNTEASFKQNNHVLAVNQVNTSFNYEPTKDYLLSFVSKPTNLENVTHHALSKQDMLDLGTTSNIVSSSNNTNVRSDTYIEPSLNLQEQSVTNGQDPISSESSQSLVTKSVVHEKQASMPNALKIAHETSFDQYAIDQFGAFDMYIKEEPSFLESLFGLGVPEAHALESQDGIANFFLLRAFPEKPEKALDQQGNLLLLKNPSFQLKPEELLTQDKLKPAMLEQVQQGYNYISYLLHQQSQFNSKFDLPIVVVKGQGLARFNQEFGKEHARRAKERLEHNKAQIAQEQANRKIAGEEYDSNPVSVAKEDSSLHLDQNERFTIDSLLQGIDDPLTFASVHAASGSMNRNYFTYTPNFATRQSRLKYFKPFVYNGDQYSREDILIAGRSGRIVLQNFALFYKNEGDLKRMTLGLDSRYTSGPCQGMSYIEAELKGYCRLVNSKTKSVQNTVQAEDNTEVDSENKLKDTSLFKTQEVLAKASKDFKDDNVLKVSSEFKAGSALEDVKEVAQAQKTQELSKEATSQEFDIAKNIQKDDSTPNKINHQSQKFLAQQNSKKHKNDQKEPLPLANVIENNDLQKYPHMLVFSELDKELVEVGIYTNNPLPITPNVMQVNGFARGVESAVRMVGFGTSFDSHKEDFSRGILSSFDQRLFSLSKQDYIASNDSLNSLDPKCSLLGQRDCAIYFVGPRVTSLLSVGNEYSYFNMHTSASLERNVPLSRSYEKALNNYMKKGWIEQYNGRRSILDVASAKQQIITRETQIDEINLRNSLAQNNIETAEKNLAKEIKPTQPKLFNEATAAAAMSEVTSLAITQARQTQDIPLEALKNQENLQESDVQGQQVLAQTNDQSVHSKNTDLNVSNVEISVQQDVQESSTNKLAKNSRGLSQDRRSSHSNSSKSSTIYSNMTNLNNTHLFGIPVVFSRLGVPQLALRNTVMSIGDYKNYAFLTELEMAVLSDLGYKIEPKEFYGTSIYSNGTKEQRINRIVSSDFAFYDHFTERYDVGQPSEAPWATGIHIYGSYNDVVHNASFDAVGYGNLGVRIDGSDNYYYQTPSSSIVAQGEDSVGLAFTYGRDNKAYISGYIGALGPQGIGIKVDMGSNIYSDLIEYRGSYSRARSRDYLTGRLTKDEASAAPIFDDLNGPQVKKMIIDGIVEGAKAAIWIDESSLVREINLSKNAFVRGGINSLWHPVSDGLGHVVLVHETKFSKLLDAYIQHPRFNRYNTAKEFIAQELMTELNLGVMLDQNKSVVLSEGKTKYKYLADPKASILLVGNLVGNTININHVGGITKQQGSVKANILQIFDGVFRLHAPQNTEESQTIIHKLNQINMHSNAVFDLVDNKSSITYIKDSFILDHNAVIRLDVNEKGELLDKLVLMKDVKVSDNQVSIEPALTYDIIRRLNTDPKSLFNFISNVVKNANKIFAPYGISVRFPRLIWDSDGAYGRELKCTSRGCRIGGFVSNGLRSDLDNIAPWRYYVSFGSIFAFIIGFYAYYFIKRYRFKRQNKH